MPKVLFPIIWKASPCVYNPAKNDGEAGFFFIIKYDKLEKTHTEGAFTR